MHSAFCTFCRHDLPCRTNLKLPLPHVISQPNCKLGWFTLYLCSCRVVIVVQLCFIFVRMQSYVVLRGQVKQYSACESQHQHGAFDMTILFSTQTWGSDPFWLLFLNWVIQPPSRSVRSITSWICSFFAMYKLWSLPQPWFPVGHWVY